MDLRQTKHVLVACSNISQLFLEGNNSWDSDFAALCLNVTSFLLSPPSCSALAGDGKSEFLDFSLK